MLQLFQNLLVLLSTDSAYVAGILQKAENSFLKAILNNQLYLLLKNLILIFSEKQHPYYVMHIHSHALLLRPLTHGNRQPDTVATTAQAELPNIFEQANLSHAFFHQNAHAVHCMFNITKRLA